jgi:hypothetical protein
MTRTQKYIDKYCEYVDRLISFWEGKGGSEDDVWRILAKADFIAEIIGIKEKGSLGLHFHEWTRRDYLRKQEQEGKETFQKNGMEFKIRVERLDDWKQKALAVKLPIQSIETYDYNRRNITKERIAKLLESLKYMQLAIDSGVFPREIELYGISANKTVVEMGLVSQYRRIAFQNQLILWDKLLPYNGSDWTPEVYWQPSQYLKNRVAVWLDRTQKLNVSNLSPLTPDVQPIPIDEEKLLAFDGTEWHRISPTGIEIIKKLNSKPGAGLKGEQLKSFADSGERPDQIIKKLPKSIRNRIENTRGLGYHLV